MSELFLKIVNMSISATWLVLAVLILRLVLKKAPKWSHVLLWGLVGFRLICPFTLESALSLIPSAQTISPEIMMDATPEIHTGIESVNRVVNPIITEAFAPEPVASANPLQILIPIAAIVWCMGMALMALYTLLTYWRLRRKVRLAIRVKDNIYVSEAVSSPFVLGIIRPRIYLPYHMAELDRYHVIAHERTHIRRKDHWWKPLGFALLTVHWFNPLLWLAYVLLCRDIELACDEKVVGHMRPDQRANYSQALLNCSIDRRSIAACPLAFGEVGVKERVRNVLRYRKPAFWVILLAVIVCIAVAVCFLTDPETPAELENLTGKTYEVTEMAYSDPRYSFNYNPGLNTPSYAVSETGHLLSKNDVNFDTWTDLGRLEVTELTKENFDDYFVADEDFRDGTTPSAFRRENVQAWQVIYEESFGNILYYLLRQKNGDVYLVYGRCDPDIQLIRWVMKLEASAQGEWGAAMSVEDVSPTGLTAVFDYTNPILTGELTYGEDYHLQRLSNGEWVDVEMLAEESPVITIAYVVQPNSTSRHSVNWSAVYGELPSGTYRIGKSVSLRTAPGTYEDRTLYAGFSLGDSLSWLQTLTPENVEKVEYLGFPADPSTQYTLYDGEELSEVLEVMRSFNGTFVEEASAETIYGGGYELTVTLKDGTVHTVHNIGNVYLSINGEYYEDTYSILNQMWASCFYGTTYPPAEVSPALTITAEELTDTQVVLYFHPDNSDSQWFYLNPYRMEQWTDSGWTPMSLIPEMQYATWSGVAQPIPTGGGLVIPWEWNYGVLSPGTYRIALDVTQQKDYAPEDVSTVYAEFTLPEGGIGPKSLEELAKGYSLEQAEIDGCLVMVDGDVRYNQQSWFDFVDQAQNGENASVRIVQHYSARDNEPSHSFIYDLAYDGNVYTLRWCMQGGQDGILEEPYQYLRSFTGQGETESVEYDAYERWVLTNDNRASYDQMWKSYASSQLNAIIPHQVIYADLIYFPDHPEIPETLTRARLVIPEGQDLVIDDADTLEALRTLLAKAEFLGYYPKTPDFGPELQITDADGTVTSMYLGMDSDMFELDGNCFDYGPGYDGYGSNNDIELLWQILGLTEWTAPNVTKWPAELCDQYESYRETVQWAKENPPMNRMFVPLSPDWETDSITIAPAGGRKTEITGAQRDKLWDILCYAPLDKYYGPELDMQTAYTVEFTYQLWDFTCRIYPIGENEFYITRTIDNVRYTCTSPELARAFEEALS